MQLPNVVSTALILAVASVLAALAADPGAWGSAAWVPLLVLVLGAVAKGLQVYAQESRTSDEVRSASERKQHGKLRRMLVD